MYFKYYGIDKNTGKIRISFLQDGLFRFTQPNQLKDPKEGRPKVFINEYSPKDIAFARCELLSNRYPSVDGHISDQDVIAFGLDLLPAKRWGDVFPHLVKQEGHKSMEEYDRSHLLKVYNNFQDQLNKEVGVFSLTKDNKNLVMWASYANKYNGIVIEFDERIIDLDDYICSEVIYDPEAKACEISLNKGIIRFNGLNVEHSSSVDFNITDSLIKSFLFHKEKIWNYEAEFRLISKLLNADKIYGDVYLNQIPFEIYRAVYIGSDVTSEDKESILSEIKSNKKLTHINVYEQYFNKISGDIEFVQIDL